jgi:hypothetical protein
MVIALFLHMFAMNVVCKLIGDTMIMTRSKNSASLLSDGTVLLAGGECTKNHWKFSTQTVEIFNPVTKKFSSVGNMAYARKIHTATMLHSGSF